MFCKLDQIFGAILVGVYSKEEGQRYEYGEIGKFSDDLTEWQRSVRVEGEWLNKGGLGGWNCVVGVCLLCLCFLFLLVCLELFSC